MRIPGCFPIASLALAMAGRVLGGNVVIGYYPSWKRQYLQSADLSQYTHINMAFAIPAEDGTLSFEGDWFLSQVVMDLHGKGVQALLSVGGWTGSNHFSNIVKTQSKSATLIDSIVKYINMHNLDGIDIDWEYPGRLGNTCNTFDTQFDAINFLAFLQRLRWKLNATFGEKAKLITLALRVQPFDGPNGPVPDVSEFAKFVDYGNLMQYDINGGWNNETGPNAPLNYEDGKGLPASFSSAIDAWTRAGWPANQLVAGFAFYGRSTQALVDMMQDTDNQYQPQSNTVPLGDKEDAPWYDACAGSTANSGTWQWKHLRSQGILDSPTTAVEPWVRKWDAISQTPWLFNRQTRIYISYDDPWSLQAKVDHGLSRGLAGAMVWSANMDGTEQELLEVVRKLGNEKGGGEL
ncbi:hypothetical protein HIM_03695 [Hirsutella minnesotensis 3608]|uniref:chitinase n=1 Tax=Hirsutella minnesotensis 3608 TaxID=1043627 RepID=A0A0F7ZVL4_9HYPO|nr:hypothetical protein HIM_03695 [Hirsutella minnesotensis 3608]